MILQYQPDIPDCQFLSGFPQSDCHLWHKNLPMFCHYPVKLQQQLLFSPLLLLKSAWMSEPFQPLFLLIKYTEKSHPCLLPPPCFHRRLLSDLSSENPLTIPFPLFDLPKKLHLFRISKFHLQTGQNHKPAHFHFLKTKVQNSCDTYACE